MYDHIHHKAIYLQCQVYLYLGYEYL